VRVCMRLVMYQRMSIQGMAQRHRLSSSEYRGPISSSQRTRNDFDPDLSDQCLKSNLGKLAGKNNRRPRSMKLEITTGIRNDEAFLALTFYGKQG